MKPALAIILSSFSVCASPPAPDASFTNSVVPITNKPVILKTNLVEIAWTASKGATYYEVLQSTNMRAWEQVDSVTETFYWGDAVTPGATFWRVAASNKLPAP